MHSFMDKAETMEFIWRNIILYYRMLLFTLRKFLRLQIFHKCINIRSVVTKVEEHFRSYISKVLQLKIIRFCVKGV